MDKGRWNASPIPRPAVRRQNQERSVHQPHDVTGVLQFNHVLDQAVHVFVLGLQFLHLVKMDVGSHAAAVDPLAQFTNMVSYPRTLQAEYRHVSRET